jgi:defect-in-organelle-trafficking protein DotC
MKIKFTTILATSFLILFISSCSSSNSDQTDDHDIAIRTQGVSSAAFSYGAQSGLAWQADNINKACEKNEKELSQIYNFNSLLMKNSLLPPVVAEVTDSLRVSSNTIRLADKTVEILSPARFVSTPPSWRDYIQMTYKYPEHPNTTLLPRTAIERQLWDEEVQKGWEAGVAQANNILIQSLGRLNRDFSGIALYHALHSQNMISSPKTAKAHMGITGDKQRMRINDQIVRITSHANLQPNLHENWRPALIVESKTPSMSYVARK